MEVSTKIWGYIPLFIFLFVSAISPSMAKPNPDTATPDTECSICGHDLQKLILSINTWTIVMNSSLSAEKHGHVLDLNKDEFSNNELIGEWDEEATQDECHKNLAEVKNALWNAAVTAFDANGDQQTFKTFTDAAHTLPRALNTFDKHRKDNPKWALYDKKIRHFMSAMFQKYEYLVGKIVVETLKSGTKPTEDASDKSEDESLQNASKLVENYLGHNRHFQMACDRRLNLCKFVQHIKLTSDVIQEEVVDIFRKNSDVDKELTKRVLEFGALTWPDNTVDFYKKIVFKLSEI